ncbi:MAG: glycosyl hydrolase [Chitinophagaceae bacterium]|nr:glycosyl hydrolase [Chitinophagaceae bacterium]
MKKIRVFSAAAFLSFAALSQTTNTPGDNLYKGFITPNNAAKPRVWWHWMNGNITKEGIQKDLDWMKRAGIGGFQNFDANLFTPVVVPKKLVFMTPEWKDAFKFATELADKNGLEMAIAGSPGWSVTGGPWVEPKDGMKKYVWTETRVPDGNAFNGKLSQPLSTTGKFQNVELATTTMLGESTGKLPTYYGDAAVIAYRLPAADKVFTELNPKVSSSGGSFNLKDLTDGNLNTTNFLPPVAVGEDMWIQYEFETAQTFKAFSIVGASHTALEDFNGGPLNRALKVSDDGVTFKEVVAVSGSIVPQNTVNIPPVTARYFRFTFKTLPPEMNMFAAMAGVPQGEAKPKGIDVAEIVLHNTDRIDQFEDKAGFTPWKEDNKSFKPSNADVIPSEGVIDLTSKMKADGSLEWTPPSGGQGDWVIIRFGYSLTGRQNHPASPEATGLEVDKLDKEAVKKYINTYLDMYKDATGGMMGNKGLQYMILDSYEAGHMTWTKTFPEEFFKRRGYDIKNWIPVLTGRIVKSFQASEQFLWDFRKTIGELIAESHYDVIGEELHKRGMKRYTESHEDKRIYLADGMDVKRNADIPMSAMWTPGSLAGGANEEVRSEADIRESASVAHIYGKDIVAAESMTSIMNAFSFHPEKLKRTADLEMASGLNRFVIHTSVHQPLDDKKPGFSLGPFGQYFTRQETWSGAGAKAWMDYLGRSSYMLQQGKFVADVLYLYGENTNITWQFKEKLPVIAGYEFDFCNSSALQTMQVKNGKIIAPSGAAYSLLVLDESAKKMTLPVLRKIKELVNAGAKIAGIKPEKSPSMSDNHEEFQAIVNEIWGKNSGLETHNFTELLRGLGVQEDVIIQNAKAKILYVHRKTANADIYWLDNRSENSNEAEISFRVSGKVPELWHPQTGKTEKLSWQIKDGRTIIPLRFDSWEAYFIVFSKGILSEKNKTTVTAYTKPATVEKQLATITGEWNINFQQDRGAPSSVKMNELKSWSEHTDNGVKYFSGTATYLKTINAPASWFVKGAELWIDLGDVKNIAEIKVNGKPLGVVWKKPFRINATGLLKAGDNKIEISVTNLWVNRLIGDVQPGVTNKITFTTMPFYQANSKLLPSGLLGPVTIFSKK